MNPDPAFPPYAFVPGRFPHPNNDPKGHSFGKQPEPVSPLDPQRWQECREYLRGLELFNAGYYWEAHEAWEALWHAAGRKGTTATFLKGLIRLAAAGVKVREGIPRGVVSHAGAAADFFRRTAFPGRPDATRYCGLLLADLIRNAAEAAATPARPASGPLPAVEIVFPFGLQPLPAPEE